MPWGELKEKRGGFQGRIGHGAAGARLAHGQVFPLGDVDDESPLAESQCLFDRVGETFGKGLARLEHQTIDDDFDGVLLLLGQGLHVHQSLQDAVDADAREALTLESVEAFSMLPLAVFHDGREQHEAGLVGQLPDLVDHGLGIAPSHCFAAVNAILFANAGVEDAEVVVDFRDGPDGGARVTAGGLLLNRDGGGKAADGVVVRFVHLADELAGIGAERFHVATLALGKNRVEGQAGLTRSRHAGKDDETFLGQFDVDVLEVVFSGAFYDDGVQFDRFAWSGGSGLRFLHIC